MRTPTYYKDVSEKALNLQKELNLTDVQTLLYNHICRGDFYLRNGDGQSFYDKNTNGFNWTGNREWVKKQFKPLIKNGYVIFESLRNCRSKRYTSWVFYAKEFEYKSLMDASSYLYTDRLAKIKTKFNIPDGCPKNTLFGDVEFVQDKNGYALKYKGEMNTYFWNPYGGRTKFDKVQYHYRFQRVIQELSLCLDYHNSWGDIKLSNYTTKRRFKIN